MRTEFSSCSLLGKKPRTSAIVIKQPINQSATSFAISERGKKGNGKKSWPGLTTCRRSVNSSRNSRISELELNPDPEVCTKSPTCSRSVQRLDPGWVPSSTTSRGATRGPRYSFDQTRTSNTSHCTRKSSREFCTKEHRTIFGHELFY